MKVQHGHIQEVSWKFARIAEKQDKAIRPAWTAVERSSMEGRRRKETAQDLFRPEGEPGLDWHLSVCRVRLAMAWGTNPPR